VGKKESSRSVEQQDGPRVPAIPAMRPSRCVAAFDQENEAGDVDELCFGKTEQEVVGACHEAAIRDLTVSRTVNARRGAYQARGLM
jgi:hypothetical protein